MEGYNRFGEENNIICQKVITRLICSIFNHDREGIRHNYHLSKVCITNIRHFSDKKNPAYKDGTE